MEVVIPVYQMEHKSEEKFVLALPRGIITVHSNQDIAAVGETRPGLYQVAGTGDATFCDWMVNFHH